MPRRRLIGIITGLLSIGTLAWWWPRDTTPPPTALGAPVSGPIVRKPAALPGKTTAPPVAALPEFGTEAFNQLAKERGAAWMASRNRDAVSLLAMWDLTGDEAILREAAEKFPGNPQVCLAMLGLVFKEQENAAEQKKWTDLVIAADPENPLGYYYQARLAEAAGDRAGVIAALETALGKNSRINHYLRERMMGAKEGLLASGVPLKDAYYLSLAGPMGKAHAGLFGSDKIIGFFKKELANLKAAGHDEARQSLAALGLKLSEQQRLTQSPTLMSDLTALSWRGFFLKELDAGSEIVNTGRTAGQELEASTEEKKRMVQFVKANTSAQQYLATAPLEVQGQYADQMMMDGEMAAIKYLLEEKAKSNR